MHTQKKFRTINVFNDGRNHFALHFITCCIFRFLHYFLILEKYNLLITKSILNETRL